ncbi:MAG: YlbF family regulator [Clostridia bacterium]|nr:YlbF family regulator [Clostridia bacterium]
MKVYDTANKLAQEIKESEEYITYKTAKEAINLNYELKKKIDEFEKARYEAQIIALQTGRDNEEKMKNVQELYGELIQNQEASKYFDAEMKFNIMIADINKIIGEVVQNLIK